MTFTVTTNARGEKEATSRVELAPARFLRVSTYKDGRGRLVTIGTVMKRENDGIGESFRIPDDFNETLSRTVDPVRCTAKLIATQHAEVMLRIDKTVERVKQYYAARNETL